jgi:hypothetical protein
VSRNFLSISRFIRVKSSDHPNQYGSRPARTTASLALSGSAIFAARMRWMSSLLMTFWSSAKSDPVRSSGAFAVGEAG